MLLRGIVQGPLALAVDVTNDYSWYLGLHLACTLQNVEDFVCSMNLNVELICRRIVCNSCAESNK